MTKEFNMASDPTKNKSIAISLRRTVFNSRDGWQNQLIMETSNHKLKVLLWDSDVDLLLECLKKHRMAKRHSKTTDIEVIIRG